MLKGYNKVDEEEHFAYRRRTRRRVIVVGVSSFILAVAIIGVVVGSCFQHKRADGGSEAGRVTPSTSLKAICQVTQYPGSCIDSISKLNASGVTDPEQLFKLSLVVAVRELSNFANYMNQLIDHVNDTQSRDALVVCQDVIDNAVDHLNESISLMNVHGGGKILSNDKINDISTWLSTVITDHETCLDALVETNSTRLQDVMAAMQRSKEYSSNSLAIVTKVVSLLSDFQIPIHRRLLTSSHSRSEFPSWLRVADRRLLQLATLQPNVIVAKDKTGNFTTIADALAAVPDKNTSRFVIYVKKGTYNENVVIGKNKWNVMMYGDGKNKTIVTGKLNFIDGTPTYSTATFATQGRGFIGRDMRFVNSAGPEKHQAVAFRLESDQSVMYRCAFDAYQDTLYTYSNRQFFRECDVIGTIDFIFGNAAVVFQTCKIMPRKPLSFQFNTITAQGKTDPNQATGISIQKCTLTTNGIVTAQTYLGRPWKDYSTTVVMQSSIGTFLNPKGWTEWIANTPPPSIIFYAEYKNTGLGSNTSRRVNWTGYKSNLTTNQAKTFTVNSFIQGSTWLPQTNITFAPSL